MVTIETAEKFKDQRVLAHTDDVILTGALIAHGPILDGGEHAIVVVNDRGDTYILTLRSLLLIEKAGK